MDEPRYVDNPFEDDNYTSTRRAKWMSPKGELECKILDACNRKYYKPSERGLKSVVVSLEKQALSLREGESQQPREWIEHCIGVWAKVNRVRTVRPLPTLIKYIHNESRKTSWLNWWYSEHPEVATKRDYSKDVDADDLTKYTEGL